MSRMIRFIIVAVSVIGFLVFGFPLLAAQNSLGRKDPHARDVESLKIIQFMFSFLLKVSGVSVVVKGLDRIPRDTAVLYVGNHRSYFDILVGYTTVPGLMGFVAKKEMLRYPFLRSWMRHVKCLFLDRTDKDVLDLMPFKEGSLKIAEKSGCPIVPVAMLGTAEVFERHLPFIRPSRVVIEFGTPFYIKELEPEQKKRSGAYTRDVIREMLANLQREEAEKSA